MIQDYSTGAETPDEGAPFPELGLNIDQTGLCGPLLACESAAAADLYMLTGRALYKYYVQLLNKR